MFFLLTTNSGDADTDPLVMNSLRGGSSLKFKINKFKRSSPHKQKNFLIVRSQPNFKGPIIKVDNTN